MNETEVNIPLLRKAVEWAEAEAAKPALESGWMQSGWVIKPDEMALHLAEEVLDDRNEWTTTGYRNLAAALEPHCGTAYCIAGYVGQAMDARYAREATVAGVHVSDFAQEALGLTDAQASEWDGLFAAANTIEDIRRIAEQIAGERL